MQVPVLLCYGHYCYASIFSIEFACVVFSACTVLSLDMFVDLHLSANLRVMQHVGWWSPTIIRGSEREAVLVPNHKFSTSVVRNHTQKTHWRIKTFIGINHHDVNKINVSLT